MVWSFFLDVLDVANYRIVFDLLGLIAASCGSAVGYSGLRAVAAQRVGWSSVLLLSGREIP